MKLSVVMPCYNEKKTIEEIVARVRAVPMDKEILIVDDGSTDGTRDILARLNGTKDSHNEIRVILHDKNQGKGAALRTGFAQIKGDVVIIQDCDLEYHPEEYPHLLDCIIKDRADVVYGSRFIGTHRVFFYGHYLGNKFVNFVTNVLYDTFLTDMMTCYKLMRREIAQSFDLRAKGFGVEAEMTAKIFKNHKYRVYETPCAYSGRGYDEGKKIHWWHTFVVLYWLIRERF